MSRTLTATLLALCLALSSTAANAAYVSQVYACGPNTAIVYLSDNATKLLIWIPDSGQDQFNRIYAMALELLASQKQVGYYNTYATGQSACGVTGLTEITVLEATNAP